MAVIIETTELLHTVIASLVAGIGITAVFSVAIWGAARFVDLSVAERRMAATAAAALGIVVLIVTLAAVGVGIAVMMSR